MTSSFTSSHFASALASGTDWRDTAKKVLEMLEDIKTEDHNFNLGFLYISDHLTGDAESILNLFKSVLNIEHWVGGIGAGICGTGGKFVDEPAISAMVGRFAADDFALFPPVSSDISVASEALEPWLKDQNPVLVFTHADPLAEYDLADTLKKIEDLTNGFLVGGLTSSRSAQFQFSDQVCEGGVSGVAFSSAVKVATTLSQGCHDIGVSHTITRSEGQTIFELDSRKAVDVFEDDLRSMAIKKIDRDPNDILIDENDIPEEFQALFKGEVHAALPISESDQKDYLVRHITDLDQDEGSITIAERIFNGDRLLFVRRDNESVYEDLSKSLLALRERVLRDEGVFEPKGALYISCVARVFDENEAACDEKNELTLLREIMGDIPLTGFYAGGEINHARLYGYTGVLVLFL